MRPSRGPIASPTVRPADSEPAVEAFVAGLVLDADTGLGVEGVGVKLDSATSTVSSADGSFAFARVPIGRYSVTARAPTWRGAASNVVIVTRDQAPSDVEVWVRRASSVAGRVLARESGTPVPDTSVTLRAGLDEDEVETDELGRFHFDGVRSGEIELIVGRPVTYGTNEPVKLRVEGTIAGLELFARTTPRVEIDLVDARGAPLEGWARIDEIDSVFGHRGTTKMRGTHVNWGPLRRHTEYTFCAEPCRASEQVKLTGDSAPPMTRLTFTTLDETEEAEVESGTVIAVAESDHGALDSAGFGIESVGDSGFERSFEREVQVPLGRYRVSLRWIAGSYSPPNISDQDISVSTGTTTVRFSVHGLATIRGRVLDSAGALVRGASVSVRTYAEIGWSVHNQRVMSSDRTGRFEFRSLTPGRYLVRAERADLGRESAEIFAPGRELTLVIPAFGAIEGVVRREGRLQTTELQLELKHGEERTVMAFDGRFVASAIEPGEYRLRAHAGPLTAETAIEVLSGRTQRVELDLLPLGSVEGRVVEAGNGRPIQDAVVNHDSWRSTKVTNQAGAFRFERIAPGLRCFRATLEGDWVGGTSCALVEPGGTVSLQPIRVAPFAHGCFGFEAFADEEDIRAARPIPIRVLAPGGSAAAAGLVENDLLVGIDGVSVVGLGATQLDLLENVAPGREATLTLADGRSVRLTAHRCN
ncbi:MAG: carboxypeptidase regulatory-like domain-containing protein [Deltaproteobacteria bacterium]|nr:carboxypeptidase regulatory-like domain-containing protein [Deltaproteobacteria bacterium]